MATRGVITTVIIVAVAVTACGGSGRSTSQSTTTQPAVAQNPAADIPNTPNLDEQLARCLGAGQADLTRPVNIRSADFADADHHTITNQIGYMPGAAGEQRQFALISDAKVPACLGPVFSKYLSYLLEHPADPTATVPPGVTIGSPKVARTPFPTVGDRTVAYRTTVSINGPAGSVNTYSDLVMAIRGRASIEMAFNSINTPFPTDQERHYVQTVVARLTSTGQ